MIMVPYAGPLAIAAGHRACRLLAPHRHFRVLMENAYDSRGPVLDPNVEQVRRSVADIASQADEVEFNVPKAGTAAVSLADEARKLALTAEERTGSTGPRWFPMTSRSLATALRRSRTPRGWRSKSLRSVPDMGR
jgi:hypothetical protein